MSPRSPGPVYVTFWQLGAGSLTGTVSDVSTAIAMNRLPSPSAAMADMLPFTPSGSTCCSGELLAVGRVEFDSRRQRLGFEKVGVDGRRGDIGDPELCGESSTGRS